MIKNNSFHFSVDDVFSSLIEVTDKNIKIQNHWFFKQLYNLWIKYKIKTSCVLVKNKKDVKKYCAYIIKKDSLNNYL